MKKVIAIGVKAYVNECNDEGKSVGTTQTNELIVNEADFDDYPDLMKLLADKGLKLE